MSEDPPGGPDDIEDRLLAVYGSLEEEEDAKGMGDRLEAAPGFEGGLAEARRRVRSPLWPEGPRSAIAAGVQAIDELRKGRSAKALELAARIGLEALILTHGRPPLRVIGGRLDPDDPLAGEWDGTALYQGFCEQAAPSVGRINLQGVHMGTGFVVEEGLVLTNRHVLQGIAKEFMGADGPVWQLLPGVVTIDFGAEGVEASPAVFEITEVVKAGPDAIGPDSDYDRLDAALVRIRTAGKGPPPLSIAPESTPALNVGEEIAVIGHPGRPALTDRSRDPAVDAALVRLFMGWWGVKRFSPGRLVKSGTTTRPLPWLISHDATTTGGSSGSAVIALNAGLPPPVVGLHFAGLTKDRNYGHGAAVALNELDPQSFPRN